MKERSLALWRWLLRPLPIRPIYFLLAVIVYLLGPNLVRGWFNDKSEVYTLHLEEAAYPMHDLTGRNLADLYADYMDSNGIIPDTLMINFHTQLTRLWERKNDVSGNNPVVVRAGRELIASYSEVPISQLTIEEYQATSDRIAHNLYQTINWNEVGRLTLYNHQREEVNERKLRLLRQLAEQIGGRELLAYALTELMPSRDGDLNREVLDFLLRNAGREYVESLPAVYDVKTSFGPYQFTEFALYDTPNERRGASVINEALPEELRVPGSVIYLRGDDHLRAAWLFGVHNLAELIHGLNDTQMDSLERASRRTDDLVQFIAVAHHGPGAARSAARRWLNNDAQLAFSVSCRGRYLTYARKTVANYAAL